MKKVASKTFSLDTIKVFRLKTEIRYNEAKSVKSLFKY